MIKVIAGDLEDALSVLAVKSKDLLKEYQRHQSFHPARSKNMKRMKRRHDGKKAGGLR